MRHPSDTHHSSTSVLKALKEHHARNYESDRDKLPPHIGELVYTNSFAFLIGAAFDRGIPWKKAWEIPYWIERKGMLDPSKLASMTESGLADLLKSLPVRPRYGGARTLKEAAILVMKFGGEAAAIWQGASPNEVSQRFQSIYGVGPGIASMSIRLLHDEWGTFTSYERQMNVKADVHVMRVFKRTGLTSSESENEAVTAARRLNPHYPAELDWPAWNIGQEWCHSISPACSACPLTAVCRKRLD